MMNKNERPFSRFYSLHGCMFFFLMVFSICSTKAISTTRTGNRMVNIGVVLDLDTLFGRKSLSILSLAIDEFYSSHAGYQTRIAVHVRDSKQDVIAAASAALDLIMNSRVEAIIGPQTSTQAHFMLNLGDKAHVPIISFSATSHSLSPTRNPYFLRATDKDSAQVKAISSLVKHFSWREAVPVFTRDEYGDVIFPFLTDALQEVGCQVPYHCEISTEATDEQIKKELRKLRDMETRVFIVHMTPDLGIRVFKFAMEVGMMDAGFVWIVSNGIGNMLSTMNSTVLESLQGVLGIRNHIPKSKELEAFGVRWRRKFQSENADVLSAKLDSFGIWAHDAVVALAMAVEDVFSNITEPSWIESTTDFPKVTDLESLPVSKAGPNLRNTLLALRFKGLAGNFFFLNGEILPYAYQIVNMYNNGGRVVGYWTAESGLSRFLNSNKNETDQHHALGPVIWPGESRLVPKGWTIPVEGKKLRVGVPVRHGFLEFVRVTTNNVTNVTEVSGYCIDVFEAVIRAMPYPVKYDYIPFTFPNGTSSVTYNDLTYQVFLGNFDAVVGDVTIVANRSTYVDFTLPYTESGVTLVVPIRDPSTRNAWIFLKPLTWKLWLTSFSFFIFIGFVIWVLEHRTNEDFRGPPMYQIGTMLWFSFSTMVYAHREKVVSNLARFIMIVWVFVVLILIQTYTASLTSMFTVEKLQPTVTDINELIRRGDRVGCKNGSFVLGMLKEMKFDQSKLVYYYSIADIEEAFKKGSRNGGVAAVFDEIPYMKLLLGKHCSKYAMVGRTYKTDGFGFVFPKGSRLAPDVSRAILKVTQGEQMTAIENKWFGQQATCSDGNTASMSSSSIGLDSFWGLFLIAGGASVSALIIHSAIFLYQHRQVMYHSDNMTSLWNKVVALSRQFDHKDMSSHTFRKSPFGDRSPTHIASAGISPSPNSTQGQTSFPFCNDHEAAMIPDHNNPSSTIIQEQTISPENSVTLPVDINGPPIQDSSQVPHIYDSSKGALK